MDKPQTTIPEGFCQCGCGKRTWVATYNRKRCGYVKGKPVRFVHGHNSTGINHYAWKNGIKINGYGYVMILKRSHPRADSLGYVKEHILVMEKHINRSIGKTESIHHIDVNPANNSIGNLMLFKTNAMHLAYHARLRAFKACGHWNWMKCHFCGQWDDPANMYIRPNRPNSAHHRECHNRHRRQR